MLQWDSDDESVGDMTRVSEALGGVGRYDTESKDDDEDIDEMELLQLRNLVQQIKLQTVIGDNFMKCEDQGTRNPLDAIVTPITEDVVEVRYRKLQADHCDLLEERDQLTARVNQFKLQGGEDAGEVSEKLKQVERERDQAKRETEAAKLEVENLKICQRNLKQYYQEKLTELGFSEMKISDSSTVPLEDYNKLKDIHFALNLQYQQSEKRIYQQQEDLHEAIQRAQYAEQQLNVVKYAQMCNQPTNSYNRNSQAGLLGSTPEMAVLQQILQMNQQLNYRR